MNAWFKVKLSWKPLERATPPWDVFQFADVFFKFVGWSILVATLRFASDKVGDEQIRLGADILFTLLCLALSDKICRVIHSRVDVDPSSKVWVALVTIGTITTFTIWLSVIVSLKMHDFIDRFLAYLNNPSH